MKTAYSALVSYETFNIWNLTVTATHYQIKTNPRACTAALALSHTSMHVRTHMHAHSRTHSCARTLVGAYPCTCIRALALVYVHTWTLLFTHTYIHSHTSMRTPPRMRKHTHTRICTQPHTHARARMACVHLSVHGINVSVCMGSVWVTVGNLC